MIEQVTTQNATCNTQNATRFKRNTQHENTRLSPAWHLNLAQAWAAQGELDKAAEIVATAYAADPLLKDTYAAVAWRQFWPAKKYQEVVEWIGRDTESAERRLYLNFLGTN
jgi:hypothetical protein